MYVCVCRMRIKGFRVRDVDSESSRLIKDKSHTDSHTTYNNIHLLY